MNRTGLLLDVTGIQKYIFGTSRLRQIVGASGNVRKAVSDDSKGLLVELGAGERIKYAGGGNALLLFDSMDEASSFAKEWSFAVLERFPGIQPSAGIYEGEFSNEKFGYFLRECRKELRKSKVENIVHVDLPRYGVTAECVYTGSSAQYYDSKIKAKPESGKKEYYSIVAKIKNDGYNDSNKRFYEKYKQTFSDNFEALAGETQESYRSGMAIVHIDGNDMGAKFSKLENLKDYEDNSNKVRELFHNAILSVTNEIVEMLNHHKSDMGLNNDIFPFRPIIVGGDDVTFVCHASLGLWSAHRILENISDQQQGGDDPITACAGIAFTKPSYPFAQGYELAEELCNSAKKKRRAGGKGVGKTSFLDFHILKGGAFSDLDTVRAQGFKLGDESLIGRPFGIEKGQEAFEWLIETGKQMVTGNKEQKWPKNKIKELREISYKGEGALEAFYIHMKKQKKKIPQLESRDPRAYLGIPTELDLCEFLDVYPGWLMQWENNRIEEECK